MNKKNLANAQLLNSINATTTTVEVKQGQASDLPNTPFHATITPLGVLSTVDNSEIVEVTGVSTDSLTVLRGQRGTSAKEFEADALLANGIYVEDIDSKQDELVSGTNVKTVNNTTLLGSGNITTPDTDTTYSEITEGEIAAGTASTLRTITGRRVQSAVDKAVSLALQEAKDDMYPVGTEYVNYVNGTNPTTLLNMPWSTWEAVEDSFTLGAGAKSAGTTGGEEDHTLTESEMPSHRHSASGSGRFLTTNRPTNPARRTDPLHSNTSTALIAFGSNDVVTSTSVTNYTGDGESHNNMPPYRTAHKWERVS